MSLLDRVSADDAATLAIYWLLACAAFTAFYCWAAPRWKRHTRRPLPPPDPTIHRSGSVVDFKRRVDAARWP